ncbi:MAG: four helix bundle protein, partial [Cytophagaceae bacterium]|nr:four helix bundle protein [Gemmatimonadaceae bacterium]
MIHKSSSSSAPFEKLRVWHDAVAFAVLVYRLTAAWPASERYGLTSQVRRACVSVVANLAEGSARLGKRAFHAFCQIAYGSLKEVEALLHVAVAL